MRVFGIASEHLRKSREASSDRPVGSPKPASSMPLPAAIEKCKYNIHKSTTSEALNASHLATTALNTTDGACHRFGF